MTKKESKKKVKFIKWKCRDQGCDEGCTDIKKGEGEMMRDITENHYKNNAKNFMDKISDKNNKGISTEVKDFLACLLENQPDDRGMLNPMTQWDWNKVSFMVDSGASETVANDEEFPEFELVETTASGTEYSSACNGGPVITNMGEKVIEVMDANGDMAFMKIQMCAT